MKIKSELYNFKVLLKEVPATTMIFFVVSIICMNIFAQKELISFEYLALDCGFVISWICFMSGDIITRRFKAKAAIQLSLFAEAINLLFAGIFFLLSLVPANWGEFYATELPAVNDAINHTLGGTWYVVVGSTIAFIVSAIVNALMNQYIGSKINDTNFKTYALRSFVSTFLGQFIDNLLFAVIVSIHFFGWTLIQAIACAFTGAVFELLAEVVFSPIGYKASNRWSEEGIGKEYLELIEH